MSDATLAMRAAFAATAWLMLASPAVAETPAQSVAYLGAQLLNDHEGLEPTTDAERARLAAIEALFKQTLEASGRYAFASLPADVSAKVAPGPEFGSCGGCEYALGAETHAKLVAWVVVQKVSDLILNLNVYMANVATRQPVFVHSVDIRGNTDESWTRGMKYLVKNYLLKQGP